VTFINYQSRNVLVNLRPTDCLIFHSLSGSVNNDGIQPPGYWGVVERLLYLDQSVLMVFSEWY